MNDTATASRHRCIPADQAADLLLRHRSGGLTSLALFDTRDRASYERAHIAGAQHLTEAGFGDAMQAVGRSTPVLIYCYHGNASKTWAGMFADFRYAEVYSVDGGHDALAAALGRRASEGAGQPPSAGGSAALQAFVAEHGFDASDLDVSREHGLTPLMRAALSGRADLVDELLALGVAVDRRNGDGNNALWLACVSGQAGIVRALVAAGIHVDNRNDTGATALMYTASSGKHDMLALLLECGADPMIRTDDDYLAADLAATVECLRLLRHTVR
ncbi:MAG: ankyrin repeat domain-containing protein [Pseudomonadota bacterium]